MLKYAKLIVLPVLVLITGKVVAQDLEENQMDALSERAGWAIQSRIMISPNQAPVDVLKTSSPCIQSEVLELRRDNTYVRTFRKRDCPGKIPPDSNGEWIPASDTSGFGALLTLKLTDMVDPQLNRNYSVGAISAEHGLLILNPMPDDKPMEPREVVVYRRAELTPEPTEVEAAPTAALSELVQAFSDLNWEEIEKAKNLEELFEIDKRKEDQFGILEYNNKTTGTGPYQLIAYTSAKGEKYLLDIQTDYTGSAMFIYIKRDDGWYHVTGDILGENFESKTLMTGFELWKMKYSDGTVTKKGSEQQLVYGISAATNLLTRHPEVFVEIKVTWTDRNGKEQEDSRLIGEITFNQKTFNFKWSQ